MNIKEKIFEIIKQYEGCGVYRDVKVNGEWEEVGLEEEIEETLGKEGNVTEFQVEVTNMFDNPSTDIYSVSIVWIENGKLETILNYEVDRI